jgi:hypothetical protein
MGPKANASKSIGNGGGADGKIVENGRFTFRGGNSQNSFSVRGSTISEAVGQFSSGNLTAAFAWMTNDVLTSESAPFA